MNRTSIDIIKRQETQVLASGKTRDLSEGKLVATTGGERASQRIMANTVSNWIAECRENNRAEEVSAISRILGSESVLRKAA